MKDARAARPANEVSARSESPPTGTIDLTEQGRGEIAPLIKSARCCEAVELGSGTRLEQLGPEQGRRSRRS